MMTKKMRTTTTLLLAATSLLCMQTRTEGFSLSMTTGAQMDTVNSRRAFISSSATAVAVASIAGIAQPAPSNAAATKEIFNLPSGIKYAVLKESSGKAATPYKGDIVAVEYTGYLANGQIFDATHAEGKSNALLFKLGTGAVIPGLDDMVAAMTVGQKVQAIIPPKLAYGDKGVCLEGGECLIKPGSTLVYDIYLKKSSIPPP